MSPARTEAACLADAMAEQDRFDGEGCGRYRAAQVARDHLAAMTPERRAQLEADWETPPC